MCFGTHDEGLVSDAPLFNCLLQNTIQPVSNSGDAMQTLSIVSLFVGVALTTFVLLVTLTSFADPIARMTVH
jgi:hypothetical protein